MSTSVPLQKTLHCNFINYFCCMYITPQSSANAVRYHRYYKTWQIYILIVVTVQLLSRLHCYNPTTVMIPLLQSHYCHDYIVTIPLLSWSNCYIHTIVTIPLLQSHYCQYPIVKSHLGYPIVIFPLLSRSQRISDGESKGEISWLWLEPVNIAAELMIFRGVVSPKGTFFVFATVLYDSRFPRNMVGHRWALAIICRLSLMGEHVPFL